MRGIAEVIAWSAVVLGFVALLEASVVAGSAGALAMLTSMCIATRREA